MGKLGVGLVRILTLCALLLLVPALTAYGSQQILNATIRDFQKSHPDFEKGISGLVKGLVQATLPSDKNPVFVASPGAGAITNASSFAQWYNDVPGINRSTTLPLTLTETAAGSGIFDYNAPNFFPIDNMLFGNEGLSHNYHFTLELHTTFTYRPGQVFNYTGDDDMWVYINNRLVVDLGGVHDPASASVALDTLSLIPGATYEFDLYFAERHTVSSVFHIQTSIVFDPAPNVTISSTAGWQNTSFKATKGQSLSFSAVGSWTVDYRIPNSYVGPDGYTPADDSRIFQGCKLDGIDPKPPYAKLLARVGDSPSFSAIGSKGTLTADRDGFVAFRIHDADPCLGDNAGSVTVTLESPCPLPTGENTGSDGWAEFEGYPTAHNWKMTLKPVTHSFAERKINEADAGGGSDTCWFEGSDHPKHDRIIPALPWTVDAENTFGDDTVGYPPEEVAYYRSKGRVPCGVTKFQQMTIQCPDGQYYNYGPVNTLKASITSTTVTSERAGQTATRNWP